MTVEINFVADKIVQLNKEYNSRLKSPDLQLLRPYIQMMESLSVLNTIDKKAQPFALSLVISSIGIFKSDSELGMVGPALEKVIDKLVSAINATQTNQNIGNQKLFKDGTLLILGGIMALASISANEGMAHALYDEESQKEINTFGLELLIHIGIYSHAIDYIFETLAEVCAYKRVEEITTLLTLVSLLLAIWAVSREKGLQLESLIQSLRPKISDYLLKVEKATTELLAKGQIDFDKARGLTVILKQANFAMEGQDPKKLIEAIQAALNICEVEPDALSRDIQDICSQIKTISSLLKDDEGEELNLKTGFWQAG